MMVGFALWPRLLLLALALAGLLAGWTMASRQGATAVQARWDAARLAEQRRLHHAAEAISARAEAFERMRADLYEGRQSHEDAIRTGNPAACMPGADELRALRQRWRQ